MCYSIDSIKLCTNSNILDANVIDQNIAYIEYDYNL